MYSLSDSGVLSAAYEYLSCNPSATALFQQTGGTNSVATYLFIGTGAHYQLSGGTLTSASMCNQGTLDGGGGTGTLLASTGSIVDLSQGTFVNIGQMSVAIGTNSL